MYLFQEYMKVLYERAIAYLNVDYACDYTYVLVVGTSPLLQDTLYESTKLVSKIYKIKIKDLFWHLLSNFNRSYRKQA